MFTVAFFHVCLYNGKSFILSPVSIPCNDAINRTEVLGLNHCLLMREAICHVSNTPFSVVYRTQKAHFSIGSILLYIVLGKLVTMAISVWLTFLLECQCQFCYAGPRFGLIGSSLQKKVGQISYLSISVEWVQPWTVWPESSKGD